MRSKVAAAGVGGSLTSVIIYAAHQFGYSLEPEVAAALATLAAFVFGYFKDELQA